MRGLITYGGTKESIDGVRYLTNSSSGKTGAIIAEYLKSKNWQIEVLRAKDAPHFSGEESQFFSHKDLDLELQNKLANKKYDFMIHLAAVSDYKVASIKDKKSGKELARSTKISSQNNLVLELKPTKKIISYLKDYSNDSDFCLVGFKLTNGASAEEQLLAVTKVIDSGADYVVLNDLQEISGDKHKGSIFSSNKEVVKKFLTKEDLAKSLFEILEVKK